LSALEEEVSSLRSEKEKYKYKYKLVKDSIDDLNEKIRKLELNL